MVSYDQVVGGFHASKFGNAITNFGSADPPRSVPAFSHAMDYLAKLLTRICPGYAMIVWPSMVHTVCRYNTSSTAYS